MNIKVLVVCTVAVASAALGLSSTASAAPTTPAAPALSSVGTTAPEPLTAAESAQLLKVGAVATTPHTNQNLRGAARGLISRACTPKGAGRNFACVESATTANVGAARMAQLQKKATQAQRLQVQSRAKAKPVPDVQASPNDSSPLYPPQSCDTAQIGAPPVENRFDACLAGTWLATINVEESDGTIVEVGSADGIFNEYSQMLDGTTNWASGFEVTPLETDGEGSTATLSAEPTCAGGACNVLEVDSINETPPEVDNPVTGSAYYDWTHVKGGSALAQVTWSLLVATPEAISNPAEVVGATTRCDQALPQNNSVGCVDPNATPMITFSGVTLPSVTHHLANAVGSGLPGALYSENPTPLHRIVNATLRNANRATACPKSLPRPAGESCDEYPFASTAEGASTGGGSARTFDGCDITLPNPSSSGPLGYSVCMIDATQNSQAGSDLQHSLYRPFRVLDGDAFFVGWTSIN